MNVQKNTMFKTKVHVDLRDVDFLKNVKLSSVFSYLQDAASLAADHLGYGISTLVENFDVVWVLAKIRVEIDRLPEWDEELTIVTWPLEPKRVEFERDFYIIDKKGDIIIKAVSVWVLMDIKKRRLKRADTVGIQYANIENKRALEVKPGKLKDFGQLQSVYEKVIGYSDIDINGHLNNSKYVDYIMDCFPVNDHKKFQMNAIEVHFVNEALPGDTVQLFKDTSRIQEGIVYIEGLNKNQNKTFFKALIEFIERK